MAPTRLDDLPTWLLSRSAARAHQLLAAAFAEAGTRGYHYRLLAALADLGPASQASLGRSTEIDGSDVVAALAQLESEGLVERSPDPDDKRRRVVSITAAGKRRLKELDRVVAIVQTELTAPLSTAEREELVRLLGLLAGAERKD
ncbi:MAG: MarR family transcriptional regulator [Solirubrobacterales bacterium]